MKIINKRFLLLIVGSAILMTQGTQALTFADERSKTDLVGFFDLHQAPRQFKNINAPKTQPSFLTKRVKRWAPTTTNQGHLGTIARSRENAGFN